ncbi:MAG: cytochrome c, partial [Candidatus Acidiferrales bacterium]
STEKKIGSGLAGLMKRAKFRNGMTADDDHLRRVIERGGKDMPGFRDSLKERQIRDLIAYVKTF